MDLQLKNKIIIVTGGSSGIGAAICKLLVAEGAFPVSIDLIRGEYYTIMINLKNPESCNTAVEAIIKTFGRIDGLVNNAGLNDGVSLEEGNYEAFWNSLRHNVLHYEIMTRLCLDQLIKTKGTIVNIISKVAYTGQGDTSGYAAANGMRVGLTEYFAGELKPAGIRVNGVVVAECDTPAYQQWLSHESEPQKKLKQIKSMIPLENRLTTAKEIAETVIFLLSPLSGVSGELIFVDGGYVHLDRGFISLGHEPPG
jgi:NAD(P)-dependent dehydrogenase (short-subunit alcohol dehydrogenase family)